VKEVMDELEKACPLMKFLGSYPEGSSWDFLYLKKQDR
jgi:hypothetical protein